MRLFRSSAFTLLELLTVIAVIGLLAALIFPAVRSARTAAGKARTKVQFNQWAAAMESFRSEYGYYPALHGSNLVNPPGQSSDPATLHLFHDTLAARRRDGAAAGSCRGRAAGSSRRPSRRGDRGRRACRRA